MSSRAFLTLVVLVALSSAAIAADPTASLIHVSGHGMLRVAPDQVVIDLTVTTTDDDLIRVRENSDKDARAILALAKKHGVDEKGFEVSRLELSLDYNEQLRRQIYQVERDVTLTLNDLAKLDAMLSDLLQQRTLKVLGINFVTSKIRQYEFDALTRAVDDAKEKAAHLAKLSGSTLGSTRSIRVIGETQQPFVTSVIPVVGSAERRESDGAIARKAGSKMRFVAFQQAGDDAEPKGAPFALGTIEVTAHVEIDFEFGE